MYHLPDVCEHSLDELISPLSKFTYMQYPQTPSQKCVVFKSWVVKKFYKNIKWILLVF